jgi:hypothetical protein
LFEIRDVNNRYNKQGKVFKKRSAGADAFDDPFNKTRGGARSSRSWVGGLWSAKGLYQLAGSKLLPGGRRQKED